ncbi:hypothetical protein Vi05172_g2141 [Venturia inaequalis]|nr:hypothetical protein Vi05172_g2141 [Venturia inaequalis]
MSFGDIEERPAKKRRFFVEDSPVADKTVKIEDSKPDESNATPDITPQSSTGPLQERDLNSAPDGFDVDLLNGIAGEELPASVVDKLKKLSGNNIERAINIYLDGSWNKPAAIPSRSTFGKPTPQKSISPVQTTTTSSFQPPPVTNITPRERYLGSFGVTAWATRSGSGLISYGEKVSIERAAKREATTKKGRLAKAAQQDVVVRFTNRRGEEVGRLENDVAAWISTLLDQKTCTFVGSCVFAPDRLKTSDTIYLQLHVSMCKEAFGRDNKLKRMDSNREVTLFQEKESDEERNLRLRQVALVKLLDEVKIQPTKANEQAAASKRKALLEAAELAEKKQQKGPSSTAKPVENGGSSPPSEEEEGQELEQDQLDSLYKKAQSFDFNTPEAVPADTFNMSLRKYQRQALHWMMSKEKDEKADKSEQSMHPLWEEYTWPTEDSDGKALPTVTEQDHFYLNPYQGELSLDFPVQEQNCLGGILADEMGLGKTIEMLSLVHSHRTDVASLPKTNATTVNNLPRLANRTAPILNAPVTTLVIAPMSLLSQWQSEAEKASKPGTLKSMVYYGSDKAVNLQNLCCETNAGSAPNVIITSYGVVLSEFNQVAAAGGDRGGSGGLFSLNYFRIILDEAHFIKNRQAKTAKACYELKATHRWVLTGTPIVNRLEDLFSLVHFLRVEPWSNFSFWKTFITVPFESKNFIQALNVVQTVLEPLVLRRTKDMKTPDGEPLVPLPPKTIIIDRIDLSEAEKDVYDYIFNRAKRTMAANIEAGTLLKSYTTIFAQILRLRQTCCHPILTRNKDIVSEEEDAAAAADVANGLADDMDLQSLIQRFEAQSVEEDANNFGAHVLKQIQDEASDECPICSEEVMEIQTVTGCWHSACKGCLLSYIDHQRDKGEVPKCFNCREPINARDVFEVIRHDYADDDDDGMIFKEERKPNSSPRISLRRVGVDASAKIGALMTHLNNIRKEDGSMKSVIFSQFTSFLDLIQPALTRDRIRYLRFDGSMTQKARAAVLDEFRESKKGVVLLLSLRAGGVGLNLTAAKRVFMMDPWWSFAVEAQAIDRVHRMGQDQEVKITRFIARESIEEKMLRIQERKMFIASSLGMMSEDEKKVQRIEDIKELLS